MLFGKWRNIQKLTHRAFSIQTPTRLENLSPTRSLIRIQGAEVQPFLQALITNDIGHVSKGGQNDAMYTMFLNKAGRVLYDAIIYKTTKENLFLIECDVRVDGDLRKHLMRFRIRKKIDIDIVNCQ